MPDTNEKFGRSSVFYDTFERRGAKEKSTHYCPGCGHGTVQKMIAAAIEEFGIQDRTIFLSPVGCSVFAYYYFDTGNIQCSHGRSPAVATGVRRTLRDAVIIGYQGDGDLAGIGLAEIIHAASRGENYSVFFINNAIYGMTGGQMAPTTLLGQRTLTSPTGRNQFNDGRPIGMAELISVLPAPVYVERCSLSTPKQVLKTRLAVRKALRYQIERKGFSFVEILSPCPTNWGMTPIQARTWVTEHLETVFKLGRLKDYDEDVPVPADPVLHPIDDQQMLTLLTAGGIPTVKTSVEKRPSRSFKIGGFGGQGVLSAGELMAACALSEGYRVSWLPSYGPEMRGGSANASVICSDDPIGSPVVDTPDVLLAMNGPALDAFEHTVAPGGVILVNSSVVNQKTRRTDVSYYAVPATEMAKAAQLISAANVVMVSACLAVTGFLSIQALRESIPRVLRKKAFLERNLGLVDATITYLQQQEII